MRPWARPARRGLARHPRGPDAFWTARCRSILGRVEIARPSPRRHGCVPVRQRSPCSRWARPAETGAGAALAGSSTQGGAAVTSWRPWSWSGRNEHCCDTGLDPVMNLRIS